VLNDLVRETPQPLVELRMVHPKFVQLGQLLLGAVFLLQTLLDDPFAGFDFAPRHRVHHDLLGGLVHREQPHQIVEQLPLGRSFDLS
jgi:hypothetical protein